MECRHQPDAVELAPGSTQARDRSLVSKERLHREPSERDDRSRLNRRKLGLQKGFARLDFIGLRIAVAGWAAFDDVADVDVLATKPHRFDHLREQLSRCSDKWHSLRAFLRSWTFADKNQFSLR